MLGNPMQDAKTYREYAAECRRIAQTMGGKEKASLLKIAEAWDERALEADRVSPKKMDGEVRADDR